MLITSGFNLFRDCHLKTFKCFLLKHFYFHDNVKAFLLLIESPRTIRTRAVSSLCVLQRLLSVYRRCPDDVIRCQGDCAEVFADFFRLRNDGSEELSSSVECLRFKSSIHRKQQNIVYQFPFPFNKAFHPKMYGFLSTNEAPFTFAWLSARISVR